MCCSLLPYPPGEYGISLCPTRVSANKTLDTRVRATMTYTIQPSLSARPSVHKTSQLYACKLTAKLSSIGLRITNNVRVQTNADTCKLTPGRTVARTAAFGHASEMQLGYVDAREMQGLLTRRAVRMARNRLEAVCSVPQPGQSHEQTGHGWREGMCTQRTSRHQDSHACQS